LHKCIKPFLDPETAAKFVFCKGDRQVRETMGQLLDGNNHHDDNMSSKLWHDLAQVDCDRFLYHVPFHLPYPNEKDQDKESVRTLHDTKRKGVISHLENNSSRIDDLFAVSVNARTLAIGVWQQNNVPGGDVDDDEEEDEDRYQVVKLTQVMA
jgi:hypothetical protein